MKKTKKPRDAGADQAAIRHQQQRKRTRAIQAHVRARGQRQQARRDSR
jgi:hypothetical protein